MSLSTFNQRRFYHRAGYPEGHNKETFSIWMNGVEKTMAYPRKSLYKFMGEAYLAKKPS